MGTNRIKIINLDQESKDSKKKKVRAEKKLEKDIAKQVQTEIKDKTSADVETEDNKKTPTKARKAKIRSLRYKTLKAKIDRNKLYTPKEALDLLTTLANSKIDETVVAHLNTREANINAGFALPHSTGKKQRIAIADDAIIEAIAKGKIEFDILIAHPQMMGKIAKVARILGPKGLMPNPKMGTVTPSPEELKKKLEGGETRVRTEPKAPLIHFVIGKISLGSDKLLQNLEAVIEAVKTSNILKGYLVSTHSPSIKLNLTS